MMLHRALEQVVKENLIKKNPANDCNPPRVEKKGMKVIKPEQIGAYFQAAGNRNALPMFYLELTSGLRRGKLLALLWTGLDPDRHTISVSKSVPGRNGELKVSAPKTRHSIRTVVVPQRTVRQKILCKRGESNSQGKRANNCGRDAWHSPSEPCLTTGSLGEEDGMHAARECRLLLPDILGYAKKVPMLVVGSVRNMTHANYPRESWISYDEFLCKFSKREDGTLLYMGEEAL